MSRFTLLFLLLFLAAPPLSAQFSEEELLREIEEAPTAAKKEETPAENPGKKPEESATPDDGDLEREPFKIVIKADIGLNYVFAEAPESFVISYNLNMEGMARNKVDIIRGSGRVGTKVEGLLAQWPTGECLLKISVSEFPFEIIFTKLEEERVQLDTKITNEIEERWESNCVFTDAPKAKFNTSGNTERWISKALERSAHLLRGLQIPIDRLHKQTTTLNFDIQRFMIADPPLGSAEMDGKGTIEIIPES